MKNKRTAALRILIINWRDPWDARSGGAERVTLEHAKAWVKKGHHVTWLSGRHSDDKSVEMKVTQGIHFVARGPSQTLFLRAWYIYLLSFRGKIDVIIDEIHGLPSFAPLWAGRTKVIAFIHEVANDIWSIMYPVPISTIGRWIEHEVFPKVYKNTQFWVDSESTKSDLKQLALASCKIKVIECAIDIPPLPKTPISKEKVLTCIFVARLVKMKGIEFTLDVFSHILKNEPLAQLWVVGSGKEEYITRLKEQASEKNLAASIKWYGFTSEKKKFELYQRAHFLLHTSIHEGFGLTVLEANSQKTPAAVFNVNALRDLVDSKKGVIVPLGETKQMADTIVRVYRDKTDYHKMQKAVYTFSQHFTWSTFTKESEELLYL